MPSKLVYKTMLLLFTFSLLLNACQNPTGPGNQTPEADGRPTEAVATDTGANQLQAVDDGAPLPPRVVARQPSGAEELPPGGELMLQFDQVMDADKTAEALEVTDGSGANISGSIDWPDERTLRFASDKPLETGSLYFASLAVDATSAAGVKMLEPYGFQFLTTADLQVSQVFPTDGASAVDSNAVLTVIFTRPVVPLGVIEESEDHPDPLKISPQTAGSGEWINTSVYAFRPDGGLKAGIDYEVTIDAGLEDAAGESTLTQPYSWSFSTAAPAIEFFSLSDGRYNPQKNADKVLLDEYFTIKFLQPMDRESTLDALSLLTEDGRAAEFINEWQMDDAQIVITPTERLAVGTDYTLQLTTDAQAATGGSLKEGLDWSFTTIPSPAVLETNPVNGSTQQYYTSELQIQFASPMRIDTVKPRISISPQPDDEINWFYNDWNWSISGYFLQPSTNYEIRFAAGMEDIYGNRTTTDKVVRFTTAARDPALQLVMPYDTPMMRSGEAVDQEFWVAYTNLNRATLEMYTVPQDQFMALVAGKVSLYEYEPPQSARIWQQQLNPSRQLNARKLEKFSPTDSDGKALQPGFYLIGADSPDVPHESRFVDVRLVFVANANLTFKTAPADGMVWLTNLESGEPISGKSVTIWDDLGDQVGEGRTDADGVVHLDLPPLKPDSYARMAVVDDGSTFSFASSQWGSGASTSDYGIWIDLYAPANQPTAYIYTERPIYRPGQPVLFKGIVRVDDDLDYTLPSSETVRVKINSFEDTVYEKELTLTENGTFSDRLTLDNEAALGYYTIEVYLPDRTDAIGTLTFNVAEYRKPEFQVQVTADPTDLLSGESFTAAVQADYYSGGGVADAVVSWSLVSDPFYFQPPSMYSAYSFTDDEADIWTYSDEGENGSEMIAEGMGTTDSEGHFIIDLPVDLSKYKAGRTLIFEASVTDLAQTAVSGRAQVTAHPSKVYPGIRSRSDVGEAGEEQAFDIVILNWDGKPLAEQPLQVEIVERRWHSVQEQDAAGKIEWKSTVEEIPVSTFDNLATNADGEASVTFTPDKGGVYRARVSSEDDQGNPGYASAYLWVAGDDYIPWQQTNDRGFRLVTDQKSYTPGQTARILIASPFEGETYALVTVERGRIRKSQVIRLENNSTIFKLRITPDLAPNAYISVVVIKGVDETNPRPSFKMGIAGFDVEKTRQTIAVTITPDREQAKPGDTVSYTVKTLGSEGEPVEAEVSLSLSDLATLSLLPPNSGPILDHFYSERSLAVWTSMSMVNNLEDFNVEVEDEVQMGAGGGGGGGKGDGDLGVVAVRQDFPDTALWEAHLMTDRNGEVSVEVTLPDNTTTWRMDARAVTSDTRVGQATDDLTSTLPLLVRPQTPRFFIAGDQALLGAAVHNNTRETLSVTVSLEAEGLELVGPATQEVDIAAGEQAYLTWEAVVAADALRVDLVISAEAEGSLSGRLEDASRPPAGTLDNQGIPVYRYAVPETVGTSGQMTEGGNLVEGILLPQSMAVENATLNVKVSPTLAAGLSDGLEYLENFPYACIEQTISRFLPNVETTAAMQAAGVSDPMLEAALKVEVETALQMIYSAQNSDGGWGWWKGGKSDPLTGAYVVFGLTEADKAGYAIDAAVFDRGLNYLRRQVKPMTGLKDPQQVNLQAFILYVLANAGKPQVSSTVQLYEQRQRMAVYAQGFLAHTLWKIDSGDSNIDTILADLNSRAIVSATGTHWEEEEIDRWNWNTDTRTTAIVLSAVSEIDPQNPLNANAARWLMSSRTEGRWQGTQETAWTIMALTNWMVASGELEANYDFAVALNGDNLGGGSADRNNLDQNYEYAVGFSDLLKDELNRLAFARTDGPGNLYYTAHLEADLPVEEVQPLDQGIVISRSYYRLDDPETPVTEAKQGDLLLARLTLVAPHALHYAVVDDPLPAGLEPVDQSLNVSTQNVEIPQQYTYDELWRRGWGWWNFNHIEYHDEKVVLSADYLPAGTYVYTYLVRAGTQGVFRSIPITAQEFYFPEVYGRGAGSLFTVTP